MKMNETDKIFSRIQRKVEFVGMVALNRTVANLAIFRFPNLVQEVFDRPTPFISRGFKYTKATRENLTATVYADDYIGPDPQSTLMAQVFGGARKPKRFELALRAKGILPQDQFVVPGKDARIDVYGNMSGAQIVQILSALSAFKDDGVGFIANKSRRKGARVNSNTNNMFVINSVGRKSADFLNEHNEIINRVQGLPMGIYQRVGKYGIKQLMKFIKQPTYTRRFNFFEDGHRLAEQVFGYEFNKAFNQYVKD